MSWKGAFRYGVRGLVAAAAGAAEAQVLAGQSADARANREAELAMQYRMADLEEERLRVQDAFNRAKLAEEGRRVDKTLDTQYNQTVYTVDGNKYIVNQQGDTAIRVADTEAEASKFAAKTGAKTSRYVEDSRANTARALDEGETDRRRITNASEERRAQLDAETRIQESENQLEGEKYRADAQRDTATAVADANYQATLDAVRAKGEEERDTLWEQYNIKKQILDDRLEARAETNLNVMLPSLQKEGRDWVKTVLGEVTGDQTYKYLQSAQLQWEVIESSSQGFGGMADLALINAFQRMIDPGVSVREGDVELQRTTSSFLEELTRQAERLTASRGQEANILTPTARAGLIETAQNILNGQQDAFYNRVVANANRQLSLEPEVATSGITIQDLIPQIFQRHTRNPYEMAKVPSENWPPHIQEKYAESGDGDPDAPMPGLRDPTPEEGGRPAADPNEAFIKQTVDFAIANDWTAAQLREQTLARWPNTSPELLEAILARFTADKAAAGETDEEEPPTQNRMDFRNRGVKPEGDTDEE